MSNTPSYAILSHFYLEMVAFAVVWCILFLLVVRYQKISFFIAPLRSGPTRMFTKAKSLGGREWLRIGLGCIWILDGLLQAQPDMSSEFVPYVLIPVLDGQPAFLSSLLTHGAVVWGQQPILFDLLVMWVQISIGVLLLLKQGTLYTVGLMLSIGWGVIIWIFGQGVGGLVSGTANWFTGAPGSAIFYVLASVFLFYPKQVWDEGKIAVKAKWIWVLLFFCTALMQAWPGIGNWNMQLLTSWISIMAAMQQPLSLVHLLLWFARVLHSNPVLWNSLFIIAALSLALGWAMRDESRLLLWLTLIWLLFSWIVGQDFGVMGGLASDPGISVIIGLLVCCTTQVNTRNPKRELVY